MSVVKKVMEKQRKSKINKQLRQSKYRETIICHYCGVRTTRNTRQLDHVVPVAENGSDDGSNLVVSCKRCNREKGKKPYAVYITQKLAAVERHLETLLQRRRDIC